MQEIYDGLPGDDQTVDPEGATFAVTAALITRSARVITARVDGVIAPLGLSVPKFEVLALLIAAPRGEMSFADLKRRMFMHPATMGHTIRLLEADGFVGRRSHATDRRAYVASLTTRGRATTLKALAAVRDINFGCDGLSEPAARAVSEKLARFD